MGKEILQPLRRLHGRLHDWRVDRLPLYMERWRHPRAVYLVNTPEHRNMGDHAIAQAEIKMLNEIGVPFIEVTDKQLFRWRDNKCLNVMNGRPILVHGGGNLGTLWFYYEKVFRRIVRDNPRSPIIFLPNTIFYEEDENGRTEFEISKRIYNAHPNVKLYAREQRSFGIMEEAYRSAAIAPDMVFRLNECRPGTVRKGCQLTLRSDKEKTRSDKNEAEIRAQAAALFGDNVTEMDMVNRREISAAERDRELEKYYDAFRRAELVITDRLHGMILCAITGTPCIVIDSKSPKVRGCYEWIKDLPYIRFCEDAAKITEIFHSIPKQEWQYDNSRLLPLYESLIADIKAVSRGR